MREVLLTLASVHDHRVSREEKPRRRRRGRRPTEESVVHTHCDGMRCDDGQDVSELLLVASTQPIHEGTGAAVDGAERRQARSGVGRELGEALRGARAEEALELLRELDEL